MSLEQRLCIADPAIEKIKSHNIHFIDRLIKNPVVDCDRVCYLQTLRVYI
jgi:hypothetical protein